MSRLWFNTPFVLCVVEKERVTFDKRIKRSDIDIYIFKFIDSNLRPLFYVLKFSLIITFGIDISKWWFMDWEVFLLFSLHLTWFFINQPNFLDSQSITWCPTSQWTSLRRQTKPIGRSFVGMNRGCASSYLVMLTQCFGRCKGNRIHWTLQSDHQRRFLAVGVVDFWLIHCRSCVGWIFILWAYIEKRGPKLENKSSRSKKIRDWGLCYFIRWVANFSFYWSHFCMRLFYIGVVVVPMTRWKNLSSFWPLKSSFFGDIFMKDFIQKRHLCHSRQDRLDDWYQ